MTTDITELALLISKAKASVFTLEYISQFEPADIDSDDVDLRFEVDGRDTGTNVSIVDECGQAAKVIDELVEALEKAQRAQPCEHSMFWDASGVKRCSKCDSAELESSDIAPGILRCTECSFVQTKNIISVTADTITTVESESEPCPNGCGQLQPVTWKALAIQLMFTTKQGVSDFLESKKRIAELESFRTAYMEWSDKTDWVNTDRRFGVVKPLGKHRADVLKAYIEHLESRLESADKLQDSAFRHGLQCGFSYGQTNDQAGFEQSMTAHSTRGKDNG
ncbi:MULTISPECIES: hypothetical protein [Klebsiella pneumoniae complex]|uniref:hypothetical protein n=1 Tax=Klebsiella pneumoniae complex TaxID=3390273 RepID=UPI00164739E5|nr:MULTISPECIES: hypothetical protein [Klebsiella]MBC4284404.1 hypothetical protein [Klebsiella pneumoniae]MDV0625637.1 hypothetical protein [Klebsiella variicola subsp. variicola]HBW6841818.1 hypothetical protein [Klebsiella pneumoniae]HBZ9508913.1 hypothetical protein [Klebsiella pneumoniae]HBZ9756726.1 hypothetical protein [Klebsiella pneumoniae]